MNEYDLFDAFGTIDDELLKQSEHKPTRRIPFHQKDFFFTAIFGLGRR